jgi:hypothetical protein
MWPLWISVVVLTATAAIHILMGTPEVMATLVGMPQDDAALWVAIWHTISALLVTLPVSLIWAARTEKTAGRPVTVLVWWLSLVLLALFLIMNIIEFGAAVMTLPQWVLFVPSVALLPLVRWQTHPADA